MVGNLRYNKTTNIFKRPLIRWHGGKARQSRFVLGLLPDHKTFIDATVGGASVPLNKPKSKREILCDINPELISLYKVVQTAGEDLAYLCSITESSEESLSYVQATEFVDPLHRALAFLVRNRMSFRSFGRLGFEARNNWDQMPSRILAAQNRFARVEFRVQSLFDSLRYARPSSCLYIDPPYLASHYDIHNTPFSINDHMRLLDLCIRSKAKILLCASDSQIYSSRLVGWDRIERSMTVYCGSRGRRIREVYWRNY